MWLPRLLIHAVLQRSLLNFSGKEKDLEYSAPKSQKLTDLDEEGVKEGEVVIY